jgi:serine/threonine protein kinase
MSARARHVNLEERKPRFTASDPQQDEFEHRSYGPEDIRSAPSYGPSYGPEDVRWTPPRSDRSSYEKHEGHGTSDADRSRPEEIKFEAKSGRHEGDRMGKLAMQQEDALRYLHKARAQAESNRTERPSPVKTKTRKQAEPKRPSILRRLFESSTKTPLSDYRGHAHHKYGSSPPRKTSPRPTSARSTPQKKVKHKRTSNRQGSRAKSARSIHELDDSGDARSSGEVDISDHDDLKWQGPKDIPRPNHKRNPDTAVFWTLGREREGPRSSKRDAVQLSARHPMPRETPIGKKKESTVTSESLSAVQTLVDIPEQEEVTFRSPARKVVLPQEPDIHPTAFGWAGDHLVLGPTDEDILVATNPLGHGSLGVVEEVRRIGGQFPTLVRKRVDLPLPRRKAAAYLKIVQEEARILRSLVHPHIVTLIGSYEDMKQPRRPSYCLLMSPVGENDLEAFLTIVGEHDVASEFSIRWRNCIRDWMACLASALKYMHASGIRHQDIKPSNIIHKGDHVFFTDFSSSSSFKIGHTTSTENPARSTPMYGAPEVTSDRGKHGRTTDIFSLGCVFSDMLSVAEGRTVPGFQDFLRNDGQPAATEIKHVPRALSYSEKIPTIKDWFADSHTFKTHVSQMLHPDRKVRPTATEVLQAFMLDQVCDVSCSCLRAEILQKELDALSVVSVD